MYGLVNVLGVINFIKLNHKNVNLNKIILHVYNILVRKDICIIILTINIVYQNLCVFILKLICRQFYVALKYIVLDGRKIVCL